MRTIPRWTAESTSIGVMGSITVFVREERGAAIMSSQRNWGAKVSNDTPASIKSLAERFSLRLREDLLKVGSVIFVVVVIMDTTELSAGLEITVRGCCPW